MSEINQRMQKAIESLSNNFATVRTGRANPDILNRVVVDVYGASLPIKQVASMHVQDSNVIVVTPFDRGTLADVERAIVKASLGLNPNNDGVNIRLVIPALTEERRLELDKAVKKMAEEARVAIRNIRRDQLEKVKKDEELSEDAKKRLENEVQVVTDKFIKEVEDLLKHKEKEIMEI
ncbi:MAG: ribosome recycling factor [Candidatus Margulisbacteria bacterium]|nr:ribosome recycling factor [Candidatus Margulisiibacteriota bacterium]